MTAPSKEALAMLTPVLTKRWLSPDAWQLDVYERLEALLVPERLTVADQQAALHAAGLRAGSDFPR